MNPPYERKYHPEIIIKNVLDSCTKGTIATFLLPDKKLEKFSKKWQSTILNTHRLLKIIKLPEKTFDEGVTVSIFMFECHKPQNGEEVFTCYIQEDGLERVKNQGRQDINNKWQGIEDKWVKIIKKQAGDNTIKWINTNDCLSYQKDEASFSVSEEDFINGMMKYLMYKENIDEKELSETLVNKVMYSSTIHKEDEKDLITIKMQGGATND